MVKRGTVPKSKSRLSDRIRRKGSGIWTDRPVDRSRYLYDCPAFYRLYCHVAVKQCSTCTIAEPYL
eukprot:5842104-Pyramimonas_sp.AAC.2